MALSACGDATQITVRVVTEPLPDNARLTLVIDREDDGEPPLERTFRNLRQPLTLAVVPRNGTLGPITAEARLIGGPEVLTAQGRAEFVEGQNVELLLALGDVRPDAGTPPEDAAVSDAGAPDASSVPDASFGDDCPLSTDWVSDAVSLSTSLHPMPGAPTREFAVVGDGTTQVRLFHRHLGDRCFTEAPGLEVEEDIAFVELSGPPGRERVLVGHTHHITVLRLMAGPSPSLAMEQRLELSGRAPVAQATLARSPSAEAIIAISEGNTTEDSWAQAWQWDGSRWTTARQYTGVFQLSGHGAAAIVNQGNIAVWTPEYSAGSFHFVVSEILGGVSRSTQGVLGGTPTESWAAIASPGATNVSMWKSTDEGWVAAATVEFEGGGTTLLNGPQQFDASGQAWAIVTSRSGDVVAQRWQSGSTTAASFVLSGAPAETPIATTSNGVLYIDAGGTVRSSL